MANTTAIATQPARKTRAKPAPAAVKKPARKTTAKPIAKSAAKPADLAISPAGKATHKPKQKPVRDSFSMPKADFDLIDALKQRAIGFKLPVKKSELLRAGLHALNELSDARLAAVIGRLTSIKAGRPKKNGQA